MRILGAVGLWRRRFPAVPVLPEWEPDLPAAELPGLRRPDRVLAPSDHKPHVHLPALRQELDRRVTFSAGRAAAPGPFQRLAAVGERAHVDSQTIAECIHVSQARLPPPAAGLGPHTVMNENDDLVATNQESLRIAGPFNPSGARLRQVGLH